jgi:hypothetical protein
MKLEMGVYMFRWGHPGEPTVEIKGFIPEREGVELLRTLERIGVLSPLLFGGALRDDYLRQKCHLRVPTTDYDVRAGIDVPLILKGAKNSAAATKNFKAYFEKAFPGHVVVSDAQINVRNGHFTSGFFTFIHEGREISLQLDNSEIRLPLEDRVCGLAPLCYIGMDSFGRVLAHEKFERDAHDLIFGPVTPSDKKAQQKFLILQKKMASLRWSHQNAKVGVLEKDGSMSGPFRPLIVAPLPILHDPRQS